jgi:hypothetical protein
MSEGFNPETLMVRERYSIYFRYFEVSRTEFVLYNGYLFDVSIQIICGFKLYGNDKDVYVVECMKIC